MSRMLERAGRMALALVVAGGLGIGAQSARAASAPAACPSDPPSGKIPVSCTANSDCSGPCVAYYDPQATGYCIKGCCVCAF